MMARFYGFDNLYGIGTRSNDDNERIGAVVVFNTLAARDQWVRSEVPRGSVYYRESITAKEARREMVRVAFDDLLNRHIVWEHADLKYVSMDEIIRAYCRAML
jgi:hypothetical protein